MSLGGKVDSDSNGSPALFLTSVLDACASVISEVRRGHSAISTSEMEIR